MKITKLTLSGFSNQRRSYYRNPGGNNSFKGKTPPAYLAFTSFKYETETHAHTS